MPTMPPVTTRRQGEYVASPVLCRILTASNLAAGGSRHRLAAINEIRLGRGPYAVVRQPPVLTLRIADEAISSAHWVITHTKAGWLLRDQGSTYGTRVRGQPCREALLVDGDQLEAGNSFFLFRDNAVEPSERPDDLATLSLTEPAGCRTLCPELAVTFAELARLARSTVPIWVSGETGTGKELAAQAIHDESGRSGPLIAVNCAALPDTLAESELFGHRKGAFSGAVRDKTGLIEASDAGTLFLDEVAELSAPTQARLLRAVQEQAVRQVGATNTTPVDLRIVSATHADADELVRGGEFREDLYARLVGGRLELPPLRDRRGDLGLVVAALMSARGWADITLTRDAARKMLAARWPRNIRGLEQTLAAATARASGSVIDSACLGELELNVAPQRSPEETERYERLVALLHETGGNVSAVSRAMGKGRRQIQRWMERYELRASDFTAGPHH